MQLKNSLSNQNIENSTVSDISIEENSDVDLIEKDDECSILNESNITSESKDGVMNGTLENVHSVEETYVDIL